MIKYQTCIINTLQKIDGREIKKSVVWACFYKKNLKLFKLIVRNHNHVTINESKAMFVITLLTNKSYTEDNDENSFAILMPDRHPAR